MSARAGTAGQVPVSGGSKDFGRYIATEESRRRAPRAQAQKVQSSAGYAEHTHPRAGTEAEARARVEAPSEARARDQNADDAGQAESRAKPDVGDDQGDSGPDRENPITEQSQHSAPVDREDAHIGATEDQVSDTTAPSGDAFKDEPRQG